MNVSNVYQYRVHVPVAAAESMSASLRLSSLLIRRSNITIAITVLLVIVAIGLATGFWLLFRFAYLMALSIPLLYFWNRSMIRGLEVEIRRRDQHISRGQLLHGRLIVRSRSWLPKVWLEVQDHSTLPGHVTNRVIALGRNGVDIWRYETPSRRRGLYEMGPVTITATDPFGFFRMSRTFGERTTVLVYPSAPELPNLQVPPASLPGDGRFRRRTQNVTPNVSGLRNYEPGDSFSRVHWPATARTGELMVKLFELDPVSDIWILLDLEEAVHVGEGDDGTEEASVTVAASVAQYFIGANRSVGLLAYDNDLRTNDPSRGGNHYTRILESLALARAVGEVSLAQILMEESRKFGRHTTVIVVTPSPRDDWALALVSLAARGVKVAAVLLEGETFGSEESSLDVYGSLAAAGIYTYTVRRQDDLVWALGAGADAIVRSVQR